MVRGFFDSAMEELPPDLRAAICDVAVHVQVALPMVLTSALGVLSSAAQASVDIALLFGGRQPVSLYTLVLANSGERKTATDQLVSHAVRQHDDQAVRAADDLRPEQWADQAVHGARVRAIQTEIYRAVSAGYDDEAELYRQKLATLFAAGPHGRQSPRGSQVLSEATPAALLDALNGESQVVTMSSSDGAAILQRAGTEVITRLNLLWDGERVRYARKSGNIDIRDGRLALSLMIQPALLQRIMRRKDGILRESGLLARMLVTNPPSHQGSRVFSVDSNGPDLSAFEDRVRYLLRLGDTHVYYRQREVLTLTGDAGYQVQQFSNLVEAELTAFGQLADVPGAAAKAVANACRIAALLHVWQHGLGSLQVDAKTVRVACNLAGYFLTEFRRVFGERPLAELAQEYGQVLYLWLIRQGASPGSFRVRRSILAQYGPNCVRHKEALDLALQELSMRGIITVSTTKPVVVTFLGSGRMPFTGGMVSLMR